MKTDTSVARVSGYHCWRPGNYRRRGCCARPVLRTQRPRPMCTWRTDVALAPLAHGEDDVRNWIATSLLPSGGVHIAQASGGNIVAMMLSPVIRRRAGSTSCTSPRHTPGGGLGGS